MYPEDVAIYHGADWLLVPLLFQDFLGEIWNVLNEDHALEEESSDERFESCFLSGIVGECWSDDGVHVELQFCLDVFILVCRQRPVVG